MKRQRGRGDTLLCEFMNPRSHSGTSKDLNSSQVESVTIMLLANCQNPSGPKAWTVYLFPHPSSHPPHSMLAPQSSLCKCYSTFGQAKPDNQAQWLGTVQVSTPSSTLGKLLPLLFLLPRSVSSHLCMAHCLVPYRLLKSNSFLRPSITIPFKTVPPLGQGVWCHGRAFA